MSGTPNPSLNIRELNGNLSTIPNVGEGTILKLGAGSAGPLAKPIRTSTQNDVNGFGVGPCVSSMGPHIEQSGRPGYFVRVLPSTPGTINAVVKQPASAPSSPSSMALSAATFSGRTDGNPLAGGAGALHVTSGFAVPPSPLPLTVVMGAGTVTHTITITYFDVENITRTTTIAVTAAGSYTTATGVEVLSIISYATNIDPVGTSTLSFNYAGPLDRFDHLRFRTIRGGQVGVTGAQQPQIQYSFDNGTTFSPSVTVPSTGIVDLYTYPGGLTRWHTGLRATFTAGSVAVPLYGAYRAAGATVDGDTAWTFNVAGASIQVVQPTVPTASFLFSNTGSAVTLTAVATGGVAAAYGAFGGQLAGVTFTSAIVGTGGNAITVATVADGTGAGTVSVTGNAITIHYEDAVTTVTQVKAHFPVSTTFGSVTVAGGTGANVLAAPGDTHGATNLAGGVNATASTAAAAVAFFNSDVTGPTLAAKAYINGVAAIGTGLGLLANAGPGLAANGAFSLTALKPGVRARIVVAGNSTVESVSATSKDVTFYSSTDANGAQTSTPNSLNIKLAASSAASMLLLSPGTVSGTGAGIVGAWDFTALPMALAGPPATGLLGDEWTSSTNPPVMTLGDIEAVLTTLHDSYVKTLGNVEHVHIVQDNVDNTVYQAFCTWLQSVKDDRKLPLWGSTQCLYKDSSYTSDAQWSAALISALPAPRNASGLVALAGGEEDMIVTVYGCQLAANVLHLDMARCMNVQISQSPNQTRCTVLTSDGTQYALTGTGTHRIAAGTDEQQTLWEGENALLECHAQNVTTNRVLAEYDGVFIRQTLNYVYDGNDYIFWERRRVMNRAFRVVNRSLIVFLNANLLTDPTTGTLAEIEAQQIERTVRAALTSGGLVNDNGINHVSGFNFQVSRIEQTARTLNVSWSLQIVPLAKVLSLNGTIGFAVTITDTFSVGA